MEGKQISRPARLFIWLIALGGLSMAGYAMLGLHPWHYFQFPLLLIIAVLASRLKVKLPKLNGNMSVNLPFILVAFVQLNLIEALLVACVSTFIQSLSKEGGRPKAVQMLFNVSTTAVAVGLAGLIFQGRMPLPTAWVSGSLLLFLAGATFFLVQTIPVATIIALTDGGTMLRVWSTIVHLSFPYYVLSTAMSSLVITASHRIGWQIPVLVLPVMYAVYRSYQLYFDRPETSARPATLARAATTSN